METATGEGDPRLSEDLGSSRDTIVCQFCHCCGKLSKGPQWGGRQLCFPSPRHMRSCQMGAIEKRSVCCHISKQGCQSSVILALQIHPDSIFLDYSGCKMARLTLRNVLNISCPQDTAGLCLLVKMSFRRICPTLRRRSTLDLQCYQ